MVRMEHLSLAKKEASIMKKMKKSPYIVTLFNTFETSETYNLVLEYSRFGDVYSLIEKNGSLPLDVTQLIAAQLFLAIEFLHKHNICHR
jgi:serine/threonine protein kinase